PEKPSGSLQYACLNAISPAQMKTILRVISYLRRYPVLGSAQLFCATLMALSVIVFPSVTGHVVDEVLPRPEEHGELIFWVFVGLLGFFLKDALNCGRIILNTHFEQRVIFDIRADLYQKLQRLPLRWFDGRRTGDIMTRVVEDVTAMERVLIDGIELGVVALIQLVAVGAVMYYTDLTVALWATLPVPFLVLGAWIYTRDARDRYRGQRDAASDMNSLLHDNVSGISQIKTFTAEEREHARFNAFSDKLRKASLRIMRWWAFYSPGMSFAGMVGYALVLGFGGQAVMNGTMELGELVLFFLLLSLFYEPVSKLHQLNQMALSSRAAADRVFEILDSEDEPHSEAGEALPEPVLGDVRLENVSFSYGAQPTLQDVTLHAKPGETIALVGPTGAGKSPIVSLLCRFYEYDSGSITIDGHELNQTRKRSLRSALGYVTQEAFLFNGSVRENLLLANPEADETEVWKALESARASGLVRDLPDGLDTNVGERGVQLSGGEKQRLSIARALLKDPPILLLDEATASVDSETERLIQEALAALMADRSAFVIAHRLSTIRNADRIYVLDQGTVVQEGTHRQLLAAVGLYAELSRQALLIGGEKLSG
ncbi:MAG: ABC transporter ATP-binding protein/permease, partial [Roseibacillus sp.]|nr:ABC transporter ATP-binding protein/permease [Roseibacillus sp.]